MLRHSRRFQLAGLAATVAGLAALGTLGACSSGQISETAYMRAAVPGVSQNFNVTGAPEAPATNVALRNMLVVYGGVNGYPAGASAPLQLSLFNNTPAPVKVTISAPAVASGLSIRQNPAASMGASVGASPQSAEPSGSPSASASNSPSAVPTGSPAATKSAAPSGTPAGSTSAKPSASASESPSSEPASSAPATGGSSVSFTIAPNGFATFGPHAPESLILNGLKNAISGGGIVRGIEFRFELGQGLQLQEQPVPPAPGASPINASCAFDGAAAVCRAPVGIPPVAPERPAPIVTGAGE